ncbi:cytochrome P450 [Allokutzneria sp. A3M-2-11 16]|uniref:cytochrome P450 family protein n=1 Tax=Allokutzneria sp. A3M-2-11 16 TaxID=2962043 RepID=UPI0020B8B50C|nr:cytochrome P450 [Allokutzneria sp. A3M-2-11 16]MCP3802204.1 cytochrome P450 [Allokutzneria sp. A3M-2-11 16]
MTTDLPAFPANEPVLDTCNRLREIGPVVKVAYPGGVPAYIALSQAAAREIIAGDNKVFVRGPEHWPALHDGSIAADWPLRAIVQGQHMSTTDGSQHRRLRGLIAKAFTPARVQALRPRVQAIVDELIDTVVAGGDGVDLVPTFTEALPMWVICELFGVPRSERAQVRKWTTLLLSHTTPPEEAFATQNAYLAYLNELVERKHNEPGEDLTSGLVQARDEGDKLTTDELVGVLWLMVLAGHETTVHMLGHAIVALSQNPDQLELAKSGDRWADVVEETLRYRHSVMWTSFRYALEDVTVDGVHIPKGSAVGVSFQAAGQDPAVYGETANEFDLTRDQAGHPGFGFGPRFCVGAHLARLEGELALATLYRRLPELSLAIDPAEIPYSASFITIGPTSIPVNLGAVKS